MRHVEGTSPEGTVQGLPVACVHCRVHRRTEGARWELSSLKPEIRWSWEMCLSVDEMSKITMDCILITSIYSTPKGYLKLHLALNEPYMNVCTYINTL